MRHLLLFCLLICGSVQLSAQSLADRTKMYGSLGISLDRKPQPNFEVCFLFDKKFAINIGISSFKKKSAHSPKKETGLLNFYMPPNYYYDEILSYHMSASFIEKLTQYGNARIKLTAGLGVSRIKYKYNFKKSSDPLTELLVGTKYNHSVKDSKSLFLLLKPELEIPFNEYVGLAISPYAQIGSERGFAGFEFKLLVGVLY